MKPLTLFNSLSRKKEVFKPISPKEVKIYTCGPTVYWFQHIGNLRTYVFSDVLRRVLEYNGYKVNHIINVTDVGHLLSDSDEGDDRMEFAARREGKSASDIAKFYFDIFVSDFGRLNILQPTKWAWATKHIAEQIAMIQTLEQKGYTYKTSDGIYFDTSKFKDYGKLSRRDLENQAAGKRVTLKEKKNTTDFALWKFSSGEKRLQEWDSPWGVGFPGWHIECSAMSIKYLGTHFDIHTGGEDHAMVHHENEIAQSHCALDTDKWVNIWMHTGFLNFIGEKMSKSSGKIKTISDLSVEGIKPLAYRYFTFTAHYRKPLTWSKDAISSAVDSFNRLKKLTTTLEDDNSTNDQYLNQFHERINDDLDIPGAIAVLWRLLRDKSAVGKFQTVKKMDEVFALDLLEKEEVNIPNDVKELADERQKAREANDWSKSDELRDMLKERGWKVNDSKDGFVLEKL